MTTIKIVFSTPKGTSEIRRFPLNTSTSTTISPLQQIHDFLFKTYGVTYTLSASSGDRFLLHYQDDDGDSCLIESEVELKEAMRLAEEEKKPLKIMVSLDRRQFGDSFALSRSSSIASNSVPSSMTSSQSEPDFVKVEDLNKLEQQPPEPMPEVLFQPTVEEKVSQEPVKQPEPEPEVKSEPVFEREPLKVDEKKPEPVSTPAAVAEPVSLSISAPVPAPAPAAVPEPVSLSISAPVPAPTPAAVSTPVSLIHPGIRCDGCSMSPIVGDRYTCTECSDFDLCTACEATGIYHPQSHVLLKLRQPLTRDQAQKIRHCKLPAEFTPSRPRAEFISDLNLCDGVTVECGSTLKKIWSLKNSGPNTWPQGCKLVFTGGDIRPAGADEEKNSGASDGIAVPCATPGHIVHLSIDIVVPSKPGRFRGTFRLQTPDGLRFGPRIWIDLIAKAKAAASPVKAPAPAPVVPAPMPKPSAPPAEPVEGKSAPSYPVVPSSPLAKPVIPAPAPEPYATELASLHSMGFSDRELNRYLLSNNKGDVTKVISWLLGNAPAK